MAVTWLSFVFNRIDEVFRCNAICTLLLLQQSEAPCLEPAQLKQTSFFESISLHSEVLLLNWHSPDVWPGCSQ